MLIREKIRKDFKYRFFNYKIEQLCIVYRSLALNKLIRSELRIYSRFKLFKLSSKKGFPNNFVNRCIITGRARSINRSFKVSRMEFRRLAKVGKLLGVKKSSW